jgi:hypothetical protein
MASAQIEKSRVGGDIERFLFKSKMFSVRQIHEGSFHGCVRSSAHIAAEQITNIIRKKCAPKLVLEVVGPAARHRLIRNLKFGAISLGAEARICERAQAIFSL